MDLVHEEKFELNILIWTCMRIDIIVECGFFLIYWMKWIDYCRIQIFHNPVRMLNVFKCDIKVWINILINVIIQIIGMLILGMVTNITSCWKRPRFQKGRSNLCRVRNLLRTISFNVREYWMTTWNGWFKKQNPGGLPTGVFLYGVGMPECT